MSASVNRREREYAESHSDHLLISSSGTTDTVIVHTNTDTHTQIDVSNIKISRCAHRKPFPVPPTSDAGHTVLI